MRPPHRRDLIVPTLLAVVAIVTPGCGGEDKMTSTATEASTSTTAATEAPTTTAPTDGGSTASGETGSESTTGEELPDCRPNTDMAACQAVPKCAWEPEGMVCYLDCTMLLDEASCMKDEYCSWFEGTCYPPI